jgi:hypothetical protein
LDRDAIGLVRLQKILLALVLGPAPSVHPHALLCRTRKSASPLPTLIWFELHRDFTHGFRSLTRSISQPIQRTLDLILLLCHIASEVRLPAHAADKLLPQRQPPDHHNKPFPADPGIDPPIHRQLDRLMSGYPPPVFPSAITHRLDDDLAGGKVQPQLARASWHGSPPDRKGSA